MGGRFRAEVANSFQIMYNKKVFIALIECKMHKEERKCQKKATFS